jgi:hypothetical protein
LGLFIEGDVSDTVDFGWFSYQFEEDRAGGTSPVGIAWTMTSKTIAESSQGGLEQFADHTHAFVVDVPKLFFSNQRSIKLTIRLGHWTNLSGLTIFVRWLVSTLYQV